MANLIELLVDHLLGKLDAAGERELSLLISITPDEIIEEELEKVWSVWNGKEVLDENKSKAILEGILQRNRLTRPNGVLRSLPRVAGMWKWIAAAVIIGLLATGIVTILNNNSKPAPRPVATTQDVPAPKETRAVITLANGSKVYLDSVENGTIAKENNVNVVKNSEGAIIYSPDHQITPSPDHPIAYNTLFNPRGSKVIDITLSDGSHVWLNSGSSIKYPVDFIGKERVVEITGEAYFEVKHNAKQPFKVQLPNGTIVEDIGTSFNINAYSDENDIKTTLIEGSIAVSLSGVEGQANRKILKPGEQAIVNASTPLSMTNSLRVTKDVDLDEILAWKNGQFTLRSTDIAMLMRQIARWYDVDVVYEGSIPQNKFGGSLSRDLNLSTLLKALQQSGINVRLENRKIIVR
jgi:ferric-dicitrate binding protein FerR (iron transport regulator)